jgi:hypothetical protein
MTVAAPEDSTRQTAARYPHAPDEPPRPQTASGSLAPNHQG